MEFTLQNNSKRPLQVEQIDDIEKAALNKLYDNTIKLLDSNPSEFGSNAAVNMRDLRKVENNCFQLAADLDLKIKKNEIHPDDQIVTVARKFTANCDYYDIIKQVQNNPAMLKNGTTRKQLIKIAQECSAAAFKMASYRKQTRQTSDSRLIIDATARIEQKLDLLLLNRRNAPVINAAPEQNEAVPAAEQQANEAMDVDPIVHIAIPQVPGNPRWLVKRELCETLASAHRTLDGFLHAFVPVLFTNGELLAPECAFHDPKKEEVGAVVNHYFRQQAEEWDNKLKKILYDFRHAGRRSLKQKMAGRNVGFAVTENNSEYVFSNNGRCYSGFDSHRPLPVRLIHNIAVPTKIGAFEEIYLFTLTKKAKQNRFEVKKLTNNGLITLM
jgi:hypothetical protein